MPSTKTTPVPPAVTVPRFKDAGAPTVTITRVDKVISSEPIDGRDWGGGYQSVLLDTRTGELTFHESTQHLETWNPEWRSMSDVPRETYERWHPGAPFGGSFNLEKPVPELCHFHVDSNFTGRPALGVEQANALLRDIEPYAQDLLDNLFVGAGELDYSAESITASHRITWLCSRHSDTDSTEWWGGGNRAEALSATYPHYVNYGDVVARFPQVYQPQLLGLSLDQLADRCASITRHLGCNEHWHPEILAEFGVAHLDGGHTLTVVGSRAWYRSVLANGDPRPLTEYPTWDRNGTRLATGAITSTSTPEQLDAWAQGEVALAAREGLRLIGAAEAAREHQLRLREQEWNELAVIGSEVARLERELEEQRELRAERIQRVFAWGDGKSDAAIGDRARMTRQAVYNTRMKWEAGGPKAEIEP